jgi:PAS domain-containing protein
MKKFNDLSVKVRLPILMGLASLAVFTLVCLLVLFPLRNSSQEGATTKARLEAEFAGESLTVEINRRVDALRAYSDVITQLAETALVPNELKRELLLNQLKALGDTRQVLPNLWVILEPNALDGMDSLYVNRVGSNANGVFTPWFTGAGDLINGSHSINSDMYRVPRDSEFDYISEPYEDEMNGTKIYIFSVSVPIRLNGKFLGVIGTNYHVSQLNRQIENILGTHNDGKLITSEGSIVVYRNTEEIGKLVDDGNREIINKLKEGKLFEGMYNYRGRDVWKVFVPIRFGNTRAPWFYVVDVPSSDIFASTRDIVRYLVIYCILGILLIIAAGWGLITPILKKIIDVTGNIRQISLGRINHLKVSDHRNTDEIGEMISELNRLAEGLKQTSGFAHNIGEGNFDTEYKLLSDDDTLGNSLLEMRNSLQKASKEQEVLAKEEERRNWGTEGLAKFAEILRRDNDSLETLSYNIVSNMVKYLGINQGAIFILDQNDAGAERVLEMKACYAYDRKKFATKQIHPGEGLVGSCYLEGAPIYMTDVPNEYINITSGLGEANPKAIYICPLKVNDITFGVIELASFHDFEPHQLDFIQKLGESIAATISSVNINIRTNKLLEQSKLQAEEMANQEEELRQNMEEMQATQEESRRREVEMNETLANMQAMQKVSEENKHGMEAFRSAILQTCNVADVSTDGIITDVNQNMLNVFEMKTKSDFIGKHVSDFIGKETYQSAWENITIGRPFDTGVLPIITFSGKTLMLRSNYMPLCNKDGDLLSVMLLAFVDQAEALRQNMEKMQVTQKAAEEINHGMEAFPGAILQACNVADISTDGVINDVNQNMLDVFELNSKSDFVGKHVSNFIGKETYKSTWENITNGRAYDTGVLPITTLSGKTLMLRSNYMPLCNKDGDLQSVMLLAFVDQAEALRQNMEKMQATQKAAEESKHEMEAFHNAILQACSVVEFSAEAVITDVNQNLLDIFESKSKSDFIGKHLTDIISQEAYQPAWESLSKGRAYEMAAQPLTTFTGKTVMLKSNYMPICDRDGKLVRIMLLTYVDHEAALRQNKK